MDTKHTPGPWRLEGNRIEADVRHSILPVAAVYLSLGDEAEDAANAALLAAAPELLDELRRADLIILALLNVMTDEQKALVHEQLQAAHIVDDAMTRFHERREVIERATGAPKAAGTR